MQHATCSGPIAALLRPRSIALVGVSPRGGTGARILKNAARRGCPICPVNANETEINGVKCYNSLENLPGRPDCVVVSVRAESVLGVLGEAAGLGIPSAIVIAEGFTDAGSEEGRERQGLPKACSRRLRAQPTWRLPDRTAWA
jgi:acyl-CoA synthetase (NDP forming)